MNFLGNYCWDVSIRTAHWKSSVVIKKKQMCMPYDPVAKSPHIQREISSSNYKNVLDNII